MKDEAPNCREFPGCKGSRWHREVSGKHGITEYWSKKSSNVPKVTTTKGKMKDEVALSTGGRHLDMQNQQMSYEWTQQIFQLWLKWYIFS